MTTQTKTRIRRPATVFAGGAAAPRAEVRPPAPDPSSRAAMRAIALRT